MSRIKVTYYRELSRLVYFSPEDESRFNEKDRKRIEFAGPIDLAEMSYPIVEGGGRYYFVEEAA